VAIPAPLSANSQYNHKMKGNAVALMAALLATLLCVGLAYVLSSRHYSDRVLIERFDEHVPDFNRLANMAVEDAHIRIIGSSFVGLVAADSGLPIYLNKNEPWPRSESELGFTHQRWNEYRRLLKQLELGSWMRRTDGMTDVIFFAASVDFGPADGVGQVVTEKGYVYSPRPIRHSLTDSLDHVEITGPGVFFKKLDDNWYLYYEWSVAKPE
jgi:hypothetical protein